MNGADLLVVGTIVAIAAFVIVYMRKQKKNGASCSGCSGCSKSCSSRQQ